MKKNVMMRIASTTAVLVMLTTCIVSGTYAKYTTAVEASDSARIAKWGIGAPATMEMELFATDAFDPDKVESKDDNVVAPGTSHDATVTLFSITGAAPEVMYDYKVDMSVDPAASTTIAKLDSLEGFKWTLKAPDGTETSYKKFADLQDAVNGLSEENIAPNTLPTGFGTGTNTMTIGWEWEFTDNTDDASMKTRDTADTAAGDAAAAGTLDTFKITLKISATQVD